MNAARSAADHLEAWLDEGPDTAPNDLLEQILREFPARQQRRVGGWWRTPARLTAYAMTAAAAIVLFGVAVLSSKPDSGDIRPTPGWAERFPIETAAQFVRPFQYAIDPASGLALTGNPDRTSYQFRRPDSEPITDSTTFSSGVVVRTVNEGLRAQPCQESGGDVQRDPNAQQFVDYLATLPGLQVSAPARTVIDGRVALSVDVLVSATRPCTALWVFEGCGCPFVDESGGPRARRIQAVDVDGELILIVAFAANGDLTDLLPTANAFIDAIHFDSP